MHARVIEVWVQTDKVDEAVSLYEDAMEAARQAPGFIRGMLVGDRDTGKSFSITIWESAEAEQASNQGVYQQQIGRFASVFAAEPEVGSYELLFEG